MWLCTLHTYLSVNLLLNVAMYAYYTLLTYSSENLFFNMWLYTHSTQLPTICKHTPSVNSFQYAHSANLLWLGDKLQCGYYSPAS